MADALDKLDASEGSNPAAGTAEGSASVPGVLQIKADVVKHLEDGGALGKLRALMRANVYRALVTSEEEAGGACHAPVQVVSLISDFLQCAGLDMTREIFLKESAVKALDRDTLEQSMSGCLESVDAQKSVLMQVYESASKRSSNSQGTPSARGPGSTGPPAEESPEPPEGGRS
mmetsp:Transcript_12250/g.28586  ORF Transcript_12250/g.28586 Transcript_12250/m.28586 type:complete len:174 (+) Transcript_12250:115-636(+)